MQDVFVWLCNCIPANFFWDVSVRFLSWECWDFWRRHDHFRRFPKKSEVFRRSPKSSEDVWSLPKASSLPVLFTSKIRDREEGIVICSFYTWFSFLTWVWVTIFLEIVSSKTATTHIFQSGVRNWPAGVSRRATEVFNPQAWDSRLRRESWQVYILQYRGWWRICVFHRGGVRWQGYNAGHCMVIGDTSKTIWLHISKWLFNLKLLKV